MVSKKNEGYIQHPGYYTQINMDISVIIPTYQPQAYLWECLDSLSEQSLSKDKFEVIIVLNGELEPYLTQIKDYMRVNGERCFFRLLCSDKSGVSHARNMGLDNANGRYVAFIDDDDKISPSYLQELLNKADSQTIVLSNTFNFNDDRPDELIAVRPTELHETLAPKGRTGLNESRRFFFTVWMKLIPMDMIGERRFDPSFAIGEDSIFMFRISDKIKFTDFTSSEAVYYHRVRSGSAMSEQTDKGHWNRVWNDIRMIAEYTRIYLCGIRRYSVHFYLTRIRGSIHF